MTEKFKNILTIVLISLFILSFSLGELVIEEKNISTSERRNLAKFPEFNFENIKTGKFMYSFESYALDQFPLREDFRKIKAFSSFYLMRKKENNNIYIQNGYASKLDYPTNEDSIEYACSRFIYIYEKYLKNTDVKIYCSFIPDKNYFLAKEINCPSIDYIFMVNQVVNQMSFAKYIDIFPTIEISDYYYTDTHWKQEEIYDTACYLAVNMEIKLQQKYNIQKFNKAFFGVYYGQAALPMKYDNISICTNDLQNDFIIYDYESKKYIPLYDISKLNSYDPYEIYLSGPKSIITIENSNSTSERELVIFRDSFASSIAPFLAEAYSKISLIDIRYIHPDIIEQFIKFKNQDVLFIYSTLVLNNSITIK